MASVTYDHVWKRYGEVVAVQDLNLAIEDKEFLVLVGPSGCGKTTALRCLAGLEEITEGQVMIDDQVVNDIAPKDRDIAMVFQSYALYPHMSVYDNMAFGLKLRKFDKADIDRRVMEAAKTLGIENLLKRKPKELSGGQRQRASLARALALKPSLLIADEPTSALDVSVQAKVLELFKKLQAEIGFACLFITHDLAVVDMLADRIMVMHKGEIVEHGDADQVMNNPQNPYTQKLLASLPVPDPREQREHRAQLHELLAKGI